MDYNILLLMCMLMALSNIILSIIYYFKVKLIWRYIKLIYAIANAYMLILLFQSYIGIKQSASNQFLGLLVILTAMFSGLVVSFSKLNLANHIENTKNITTDVE